MLQQYQAFACFTTLLFALAVHRHSSCLTSVFLSLLPHPSAPCPSAGRVWEVSTAHLCIQARGCCLPRSLPRLSAILLRPRCLLLWCFFLWHPANLKLHHWHAFEARTYPQYVLWCCCQDQAHPVGVCGSALAVVLLGPWGVSLFLTVCLCSSAF